MHINTHFNAKQQAFLDFVLSHYVNVGVEELDQEKLTPLLRLKYHDSIADAVADLGRPEEIGKVFAGLPEVPLRRNRLSRVRSSGFGARDQDERRFHPTTFRVGLLLSRLPRVGLTPHCSRTGQP